MSTKQYVDVERTLNQLTDTEISPANIEAVNAFTNHCAAEGISEVQQQRYVQAWKSLLTKFAPDGFQLRGASEDELKQLVASLNRSEYAESTKHKMRCAVKKFYKVENGGDHPDKVEFFAVHKSRKPTSVTREDLFTEDELTRLFRSFSSVRDFLTEQERRKIREAALDHGSVPHYASVSPEERDKWKQYLAQRFGKPKDEIGLEDWERANSYKMPSLVNTALDAGLRPVEVERATTHWLDLDNGVLRIPKEDSSKNTDNWLVGLRTNTVAYLEKWLHERQQRSKYEDTAALWLTRRSNPYTSRSLNRLLNRLLETAGIERDNITWYSIRHSTGTYITREEGLAAAQAQLRHKSQETTMRYDQAPVEDRQDALERIG